MQRWEHHYLKADTAEGLYDRIAQEGDQGWELVSVTSTIWSTSERRASQGTVLAPGKVYPSTFQAWLKRPKATE
jgi:hypothetical protein